MFKPGDLVKLRDHYSPAYFPINFGLILEYYNSKNMVVIRWLYPKDWIVDYYCGAAPIGVQHCDCSDVQKIS